MVEEESHSTALPSSEEPELKFHEHARDFAVKQIRDYGGQLIRESVETAKSRRHALVLQKDVLYAAHRLHTEFRNRKNVLFQFLGAGLLGVFLQGFTTEMLSPDPGTWTVVVYVVIGFIGIFGVFWSLIR